MPDWCDNSVTITGPTETIKKLWDNAVEAEGLLQAMVPRPKELNETESPGRESEERQEELIEKYGAKNWYDWSVSQWGTKWDVSLEGLEFSENGDGTATISGWFESAWSPPIAAYETFSNDMNELCVLCASYLDQNSEFAGFWSTKDGEEHLDDLRAEFDKGEENHSDLYRRLDEQYDISSQFQEWEGSIPGREVDGGRRMRPRRRWRRIRKMISKRRRRLRRKRRS